MASEPIRSTSVVNAPKDYSIPNAQQIRLLSVTAEFIDNGATGDWLPAVVILDNNGNALCRAVDQGVKVTAGGDAEVSWFPGVTSSSSSGVVAWGSIFQVGAPQVIASDSTSGNPTLIDFTGSSVVQDGSGMFFFDPLNPEWLQVKPVTQPGFFVLQVGWLHDNSTPSGVALDDVVGGVQYASPVGGGFGPISGGQTLASFATRPIGVTDSLEWNISGLALADVAAPSYGFAIEIRNYAAGITPLNTVNTSIAAGFVAA